MDLFIQIFLVVTLFSIVLNIIFKKFGMPTIIGYIATGIFLSRISEIYKLEEISHVAEFGIVFLMFTIGLEFSFKHLMRMKKDVFFNGFLQVFVTGIILASIVYEAFVIDKKAALLVGCALAMSSTAIVIKMLNDSSEISRPHGRKALGILLFQDIAVIPTLLMIDIFASTNSTPVIFLIFKTVFSALCLIAILFLLGKYVFDKVLEMVVRTDSDEIFTTAVLFCVVGASYLAYSFGFSPTLGAFVAGMLIAETRYAHEIEVDLVPFRDMFLGLFFISVGMQINFKIIFSNFFLVTSLTIFVMAIKFIIIYFVLFFSNKKRVAFKSAISLSQVGEFALAILSLLIGKNMLNEKISSILIAVVVISMILTPFILKNLKFLANYFSEQEEQRECEKIEARGFKNHFIVCGYGTLGQEVVQTLKAKGLLYIVIESNLNLVELGRSRGENIFLGNFTQKATLLDSYIKDASAVILTVSNEQKLELIISSIKSLDFDVNIIVRYQGNDEKKLFEDDKLKIKFVKEERAIARVLIHEALQSKLE